MKRRGHDYLRLMPKLKLLLPSGEERIIELTEALITVGRVEDNTIQIDDGSVSSHHAELSALDGDYILKDLGSTNGTSVNGAPIEEVQLHAGDQVQFGTYDALYLSDIQPETAGDEPEELPEAEHADIKVADVSTRPSDFTNASPFQKKSKKQDGISVGAMVLGVLAILAAGASIAIVLTIQSPFVQ